MSKGEIAAKAPIPVDVEAGKDYCWRACAQSKSQPFCDGSHKGTELCSSRGQQLPMKQYISAPASKETTNPSVMVHTRRF
jgi:CDGSH-type Zn-finger protein